MRLAIVLFLLFLPALAEEKLRYLPADEDRPLIRRDLLPLDIDSISELARQLALLAEGPFPDSPDSLQHRAKTLTLSQRLDPGQPRARKMEKAFLERKSRPRPDAQEQKSALLGVLDHVEWLITLPPEAEGHALALMLLDVIRPLAPDHRLLKKASQTKTRDLWNETIAKVSDFQEPVAPRPTDPVDLSDRNGRKYAKTGLVTDIPMIFAEEDDGLSRFAAGLVATSLIITKVAPVEKNPNQPQNPNQPPAPASGKLVFKPEPSASVEPLHEFLTQFFATHRETLPTGFNLNINTDRRRYLPENRDNLIAPLTMMLDAAVTGRPLRANTVFLARLRPDGSLEKAAKSWELLVALASQPPPIKTRLVVAPGMMAELTGLLVLDKPSFFTRFEVLEAPTYEKARPLLFQDGRFPKMLQGASEGYEEVCEKADLTNNLRNFLSLSSVESRLEKASLLSPRHLSAKMLATYADRRPVYFSRSLAAREIDRRLQALSRIRFIVDQTTEDEIKQAYRDCRALLDPLERRLTLSDRELLDEAISLVRKINSAGRLASSDPENSQKIWQSDIEAFQDRLQEFRNRLRQIYATTAAGK